MKKKIWEFRFLQVLLLTFFSSIVVGQPKIYQAPKANVKIDVDGLANETAWLTTSWSDDFVDIEGDAKPLPPYSTRFKMLWDKKALYILAEIEEPHIWATLLNRDDTIYFDNDFEVFIDPDSDNHNYFELELNAFGTAFDLYMNRPYDMGGKPLIGYDIAGLETAIHVDGTLNNPHDTDKKWQVEMAIPWSPMLNFSPEKRPPKHGEAWRINFSRVQWQTEIDAGQYKKKTNADTGAPLPESNWVWSPQGEINMHVPERWGYVLFVDELNNSEKSIKQLDPEYETREILINLYNQQMAFFKQHKRYATSLYELNKQGRQSGADIFIETTSKQFLISSRQAGGETLYIDHQKRLWKE